jgi:hypothetical protein
LIGIGPISAKPQSYRHELDEGRVICGVGRVADLYTSVNLY